MNNYENLWISKQIDPTQLFCLLASIKVASTNV